MLTINPPAAQSSTNPNLESTISTPSTLLISTTNVLFIKSTERLPVQDRQTLLQFFNSTQSLGPHQTEELFKLTSAFVAEHLANPNVLQAAANFLSASAMALHEFELHRAHEPQHHQERLQPNNSRANLLLAASQNMSARQLAEVKISPVFTAHPTNLNRPEGIGLLKKSGSSAAVLEEKTLSALATTLGPRPKQPTVSEEAAAFQPAFLNSLKAAHRVQKQISHSQTPIVELGNWVAGDRDGNPNVTAAVLRDVVATYASNAVEQYKQRFCDQKLLKNDVESPNLRQLLQAAGQGEVASAIFRKLDNTQRWMRQQAHCEDHYISPERLLADLQIINLDKLPPPHKALAQRKLNSLITDIQSHGFHGASTDIRQNSAINEQTVATLLRETGIHSNYASLPESDRQALLERLIAQETLPEMKPFDPQRSAAQQREIELIRSYKQIQQQFGQQALSNCITANTESVSDLMEVMLLLRFAEVAGTNHLNMNVVGLIETVDDLKNATTILDGLLSVPWYKARLQESGKPQMVMVGYSDSNRLDGYLASNWQVYKATQHMMQTAKAHGVDITFFHGRGGTEARGAGRNYLDEIKVHDGRSLAFGFRQTEQGEEVFDKFGNQDSATSSLQDMVTATLQKREQGADLAFNPENTSLMDQLAQVAQSKYKSLYQHPGTAQFFQESTPIDYVGHSNAGSRPASRPTQDGQPMQLNRLRAIPWAGCWAQSRGNMPAFYGIGHALLACTETTDPTHNAQALDKLQKLYETWPFFTNLIDRVEAALAKADMQVFKQYIPNNTLGQYFYREIASDYQKAVRQVNKIKGQTELMQQRPEERAALELKAPLLNQANALQSALIKQAQQAGANAKDQLAPAVVATMQAIAKSLGRFG